MPNGEMFFVSSIQDYYRLCLDAETKEAYDQIKLCAEKQIELYPGYIYSYNYLAVCYLAEGQFQEGLKYLLQAEIIAPDDCIVLENIGRTYMNMNDNQKAEEYFMKILEVGNDQDKMYAEYYLNLL
jgi:tetratricopeptide (TPR) repeat protein